MGVDHVVGDMHEASRACHGSEYQKTELTGSVLGVTMPGCAFTSSQTKTSEKQLFLLAKTDQSFFEHLDS